MADLRDSFNSGVAAVVDDHRRASNELVARLKRLSPEAFLREPLKTFADLSSAQYRDIVAAIAPETRIVGETPIAESMRGQRIVRMERLWAIWRSQTSFLRALCATIACATAITLAALLITPAAVWRLAPYVTERSVDPTHWPDCTRLSRTVDACVYTSTRDLHWDWIAERVGLDPDLLRRSNRHLRTHFIPAGGKVAIWRGRFKLKRDAR